jgi:general secretion pathway protein K
MFLRCLMFSAQPDKDQGTVLLSTLLVLSLMSAVALALLATLRTSVTRASNLDAQAQAALYAQGAQDFVQSQLDLFANADGSALNAALQNPQENVLPFDQGAISVTVWDGTHCFRLSALSDAAGIGSDLTQKRFEALMMTLGVDRVRAANVAAASVDWVDRDTQTRPGGAEDGVYQLRLDNPHRTANVPFESVTELRAVTGMDERLFQALRPYLCIGTVGAPTRFNLDTAQARHAPVLAAILADVLPLRDAERLAIDLITNRPSAGYASAEALAAAPALADHESLAQLDDIIFEPQRLVAETRIQYGSVQRAELLAYEGLDTGRPTLSYRAWGLDEFPSLAWAQQRAETEAQ